MSLELSDQNPFGLTAGRSGGGTVETGQASGQFFLQLAVNEQFFGFRVLLQATKKRNDFKIKL
jgi:hypothetical protein